MHATHLRLCNLLARTPLLASGLSVKEGTAAYSWVDTDSSSAETDIGNFNTECDRLGLPAVGVSPLLRGVEIGLAHGLLLTGPFIKLGPLRNVPGYAEKAGCASAAGVVAILTVCLAIYGAATFQQESSQLGVKTLSGREILRDPLQSSQGWSSFSAGFFVGGLSGVGWAYLLTLTLPYYS